MESALSLLFIFKVYCAIYHGGLARKRFQDKYNQPGAQKHFSFKPLIFFIVNKTTISAVEFFGR